MVRGQGIAADAFSLKLRPSPPLYRLLKIVTFSALQGDPSRFP